ncbi:hypothetical protein [Rhizobium sp. YTU87027]|uniref:hypothetical protein n=1 Tax=Rhizobium sp. YTU87027 TaxID=3417741 RepID=UPI003D68C0E6
MVDTQEKNRRDEPLTSEDLAVCDSVLDDICHRYGIENDKEAVSRLAAIIIELYRQGVREPKQLALLAGATLE